MEIMGKCKICKWWEELLMGKNTFGPCKLPKRSDDFIYHTKAWADDMVMVGVNFGCIHFERLVVTSSPPPQPVVVKEV